MKNTLFSAKRLCRAGIIAALYVVLTYVFSPLAFGPFQIRPAEAFCILPLFFFEAVPALFVGCMISNFSSPFFLYDVVIGSHVTLLAAFISYLVGLFFKKDGVKILLGGLSPVLLNAIFIPFIIVFLCGDATQTGVWATYFLTAGSIFLTECAWVYGLGTPLYFLFKKKFKKG
jgi:uncharacterized membrane protein